MENLIGIYEKALPKNLDWFCRLKLARELGFDFVEISIDESDERLERLYWPKEQKIRLVQDIFASGVPIMTMCFSGHRRYPLGSNSKQIRDKAMELMHKAILFAKDTGIRVIQMAGYDVYYEKSTPKTRRWFFEGLERSIELAEKYQVMLAMEVMDTPFINSITKYLEIEEMFNSPWFAVYPDLGNLSAWNNDVVKEIEKGFHKIVAVHVKDTLAVTDTCKGKFRDVPFGSGCVDFVTAFSILKKLGYKGPFVIEMWSEKSQDPVAEVISAKEWVIARLKEGGF
ncbi:hexulose-6-phosphate isomerase [Thermoanaerobacter mathranii subsp. mathranii str. A3]|uniref:L-ribulose-5-phosphate 3-epimerase n=1 Tax=Thermoanaerobacter mathranii subsp. mathranii (strain DSM 11426 / CCUG 53645 / CIP 108742 / A3) TaxID=583358 RepID=A0ABM5LMZ6_THEM3|nr:L-ribulose-5-phosphate 3-epimerase [Thermoanaerobacter mathranii]ADH60123.1 hexulose-6-phosphate isomerase [Thermoanaerobacter mathranii subsp. mathranii str. A3]